MRIGWILQYKGMDYFVASAIGTTTVLEDAMVYSTRQAARDDRQVQNEEMVRRVEVFENGKIKRIIKR